jgi:hypothetical protein
MSFRQQTSIYTYCTAIFLMLTLAFLTISLPFVYSARQIIAENKSLTCSFPVDTNDCEDRSNPLNGATEEKTSGGLGSVNEEYLHEAHSSEEYLAALCKEYKIEHHATYIAFYGDLICPPPDHV